jgi:hypothetical protein
MATLTAPIRWLGHTVRKGRLGLRGRPPWPGSNPGGGEQDGWGGVREPRRPKPNPPVGAMALPEPDGEQAGEQEAPTP